MALLNHGDDEHVRGLATALEAAGVRAQVVRMGAPRVADAALRARGFTGPLAHVPIAAGALVAGRFDVAHAFSAPDALAALLWRRLGGGAAVFTCTETLDRATVADRRLRLTLLRRALEDSDAVLAASDDARAALWRWMAVEAPVIDGAAHETVYREALACRR